MLAWISDWFSLSNVESAAKIRSGQKTSMWTTVQSTKRKNGQKPFSSVTAHNRAEFFPSHNKVDFFNFIFLNQWPWHGGQQDSPSCPLQPVSAILLSWRWLLGADAGVRSPLLENACLSNVLTFQTALQHACHTQRGCLQLFCYKINNKMHVNTYIEFYWAHP